MCDGDNSSCTGCMDAMATNYDETATIQEYNEYGTSTCTYASCDDIPTGTGCLFDDGTSATWNDGWWNCGEWGGQVCGLAEVVFETTIPDYMGTPYVQGSYNGWCGYCFNDMSDADGDGVWQHIYSILTLICPGAFIEYIMFSVNGMGDAAESSNGDCFNEYTNRSFTAGAANTSTTLSDCFGSCGECQFDCADTWNGTNWESDCGCVAADNSGDDCDDCAGTPNGTNWESDCGCVAADNSGDDCDDCAGTPNGTNWESDCGCVAADNSGDDCDDCAGTPNGQLVDDAFGICGGDGTLQGAIDNLTEGETLVVPAGTYYESITIDSRKVICADHLA